MTTTPETLVWRTGLPVTAANVFTQWAGSTRIRMHDDGDLLWFSLADICKALGAELSATDWDSVRDLGTVGVKYVSLDFGLGGGCLEMVTARGAENALAHLFSDSERLTKPIDAILGFVGWPTSKYREDDPPPYGYIDEKLSVPLKARPKAPLAYVEPDGTPVYGYYAKPRVREECESVVEQEFWDACIERGGPMLAGLVTQYPIRGGRYRLDFALPHLKIGIEIDGWEYHGQDRSKFSDDRKRWRDIERDGWRLIRFSGREIKRDVWACVREAAAYVRDLTGGTQ